MSVRSRPPVVTLLLIAANLLAAFALLLDPGLAYDFGFRPDHPSLRGAFTSLFLHANVVHLLGNMVFLAAVGAAVEIASGSLRFAIVYFVAGLAGVAVHFAATRSVNEPAPLIGASGAVAGCAAYYTYRYMSLRVPFAPKLGLSVAAVTGVWVALQIVGAFVRLGESEGTAFWAHLGGFVAGIALTFAFRAPDLQQLKLGHEVLERMNARGPAAAVVAAQEHLKRHPKDPRALSDLADAYSALGEADAEADTLLALLEAGPEERRGDVLRRLAALGRITRLTPIRRMQLADQCPEVARALLRSVVEGPTNELQRPDALLALAGFEREENPEAAQELLEELVREYPLHPVVDLAKKRGWLS